MNDLFTIGEISKHQNISRQTLIFYDKIGLFRPAYVDPENGYQRRAARLSGHDLHHEKVWLFP